MRSFVTALLFVLCLPSVALAQGEPVEPAEPLARALDLLERLDRSRLDVDWDEAPLSQVLDDLRGRGVPVRMDREPLLLIGVRDRDRITLRLDNAPVATILEGVRIQLGDEYDRPVPEAHADQIVLTSLAGTAAMRHTDAYDLRDLLRADAGAPASGAAAEEGDGDASSSPGSRLLRTIIEHVDPEAWVEFGGTRGRIDMVDGALLVTATPSVHRRLRRVLARLRAVRPTSVDVQARIIELPDGVADALRRQAAGPDDPAFARALMRHPEAAFRWFGGVTVRLDQDAVLDTRGNGSEVHWTVRADLEPSSDQLRLHTTFAAIGADDTRRIDTVISLPAHVATAVIELPAPDPSAAHRVLVLEVGRY